MLVLEESRKNASSLTAGRSRVTLQNHDVPVQGVAVARPLQTVSAHVQENISVAKEGLVEMSKGAAEIRAQYEVAKEALAESNKTLEALRELDGMIEEQALMQNAFWWLQVQAAEAQAAQMDRVLQVISDY